MSGSEMSPAEVLRAAREKIATPDRWTKYVYAKNAKGLTCDPTDDEASCFCALGAVCNVTGLGYHHYHVGSAFYFLSRAAGGLGVGEQFNDREETTHADVLRLYDRAIALAEAAS